MTESEIIGRACSKAGEVTQMMFIIRTDTTRVPPLDVRMVRQTPAIVPGSAGWIDFFCLGDPDAARAAGWVVVTLRDGWYADDHGGGVAIWGQGMFWDVRDTPFSDTRAPATWDTDMAADAVTFSATEGLGKTAGLTAASASRGLRQPTLPDGVAPAGTR